MTCVADEWCPGGQARPPWPPSDCAEEGEGGSPKPTTLHRKLSMSKPTNLDDLLRQQQEEERKELEAFAKTTIPTGMAWPLTQLRFVCFITTDVSLVALSLSKSPVIVETETKDLLEGTEENIWCPLQGGTFDLPSTCINLFNQINVNANDN